MCHVNPSTAVDLTMDLWNYLHLLSHWQGNTAHILQGEDCTEFETMHESDNDENPHVAPAHNRRALSAKRPCLCRCLEWVLWEPVGTWRLEKSMPGGFGTAGRAWRCCRPRLGQKMVPVLGQLAPAFCEKSHVKAGQDAAADLLRNPPWIISTTHAGRV